MDYLLPQPAFDLTPDQQASFDALFDATPLGGWIEYNLPYPKWQFLSYLGDTRHLMLHGSQDTDISAVEPRKAADVRAFSAQDAIYATTDGIWAEFFAIIERKHHGNVVLFNTCMDVHKRGDGLLGRYYFFSISYPALLQKPWCRGAVYVLGRDGFEQEVGQQVQGFYICFPHWISSSPAYPTVKIEILPGDFPFLSGIHGHDDEQLIQSMQAEPDGFPWPQALRF